MSGNSCGYSLFIYIEDGKLEGCGRNASSQLGAGNEEDTIIPKPIMKDNQIEMICCGEEHVMMLRKNNDVLGCGDNGFGQIGLGKEIEKVSVFTLLSKLKDIPISKIQCGQYFSLILKENSNEFITFGSNDSGQLGIGTETNCEFEPQTIKMTDEIVEIVCGGDHIIVQLLNHEIHGVGRNSANQLATEGKENSSTNFLLPKLLLKDSQIKKIICGFEHTIYLKENGDLIGCGNNEYGQLAILNQPNALSPTLILNDKEIKDIFCGAFHTLILKNNGELSGLGDNFESSLGLGDKENRNKPTLIMKDENIKSICCFGDSNMILKNNGELFVFGGNQFGQLGIGNNETQLKPILLMKDEKIKCLIMGNKKTPIEWKKEYHRHYSDQFKIQTETFLLSLRIFSTIILKQKVPRPLQEIIIRLSTF